MNASELINGIAERRRDQLDFLFWTQFRGLSESSVVQKVADCGSWLRFREWLNHGGASTLRNANFCAKHLLCPGCAARRASKLKNAYLAKVLPLERIYHPAMVTLTVPNCTDLVAGMAHLKTSWSRMVAARRKGLSEKSRGHHHIEWCKVEGGVRAFEITRRPNGEWNPHLHCFALLGDWIDREKLSEEWLRFTGNAFIVDVRRCKGGVEKGLKEVLKYALKFADLSHADRWEAFEGLTGSRLTDSFGVLRGVPEPDLDSDDDSAYDGDWREFVAVWRHRKRFYDLRFEEKGTRGGELLAAVQDEDIPF